MKKPKPTRLGLVQPPRLMGKCLGSMQMEAVLVDQPPRKVGLLSIASIARLMMGPRLHIPVFRNSILWTPKTVLAGFLKILIFFLVLFFSGGNFHRSVVLEVS